MAGRFAADNGLSDRVHADVMAAESLSYDSASFDFVFMNAALHHCDVAKVSQELHRVLKPGGKAALIEDYGYHPLFTLYRLVTRGRHTPHERALSKADVHSFVQRFSSSRLDFFQLFDVWDKDWLLKPILGHLDDWLLGRIPFLKAYSRLVGIYVVK
jgi:SAM-dependent methyltransferase